MSKPEQKSPAPKADPKAPKSYVIAKPHYRLGAYYEAGSTVTIPGDEKPGTGWVLLEDARRAAAASAFPEPENKPAQAPGDSPL